MKIIKQRLVEHYFCDKCNERLILGIDGFVSFDYGYGSQFDGIKKQYHFCGQCAEFLNEYINIWVEEKKK